MRRGVAMGAVFLLVVTALSFIASQGIEPESDPVITPSPQPIPRTDFSDYLWPTDAGSVITSTFAEYRRMHFHGGIDIGTGNDTGFRVFASRDGFVSRISVSPTGYGKMLFVQHPDGFFTTYAHLRNFSTPIDDRVRQEQAKTGTYPVDVRLGPHDFPVKKGEVIAFTGETGVGTPHLHFEIRDPDNDFVNPLQCLNFPNSDTILPTVRKVAVTPIGGSSMVDGSWKVATYNPRNPRKGFYEIPTPIHVTGSAGFAIDVRDRSEGTYYRQGIHSHQLYVDDSLFYAVELDHAPAGNSHQSGLYFDWDLSDAGLGRFHRLYSSLPNDLWFYTPREDSAGIISRSRYHEGPHSFKIVSTDRGGNSTVVSGKFILHKPPRISIQNDGDAFRISFEPPSGVRFAHVSTRGSKGPKWSTQTKPLAEFGNPVVVDSRGVDMIKVVAEDTWGTKSPPYTYRLNPSRSVQASVNVTHELADGFVRIHVRTEGTSEGEPTVTVHEEGVKRTIPVTPVDFDHFIAAFVPNDTIAGLRQVIAEAKSGTATVVGFDEFDIYPIRAGGSGTHMIDDERFLLSYEPESVLNTIFLEITRSSFDGRDSYVLKPVNTVLNRGIIVGMRLDDEQEQPSGLFAHSRRGWTLLSTTAGTESRMLTGLVTQTLGEVSIVTDNTPPSISHVTIRQARQAYPSISFRFDDGFAGIEYNELKMYIDEKAAIPEVDGEHQRAVYQATEPLDKGAHLLTIRIKDKLGNQREFNKKFIVR